MKAINAMKDTNAMKEMENLIQTGATQPGFSTPHGQNNWKSQRYQKNQKGRSAIEMVGVVALIGVLTAAGAYAVNQLFAGNTLASAIDQTVSLKTRLLSEYSDETSFASLTTAYAINNFVPADAVSGTTVINRFGGLVTFAATTCDGVANKCFTMSLTAVPGGEDCQSFVKRTAVAFRQVSVAGTAVKPANGALNKTTLNTGSVIVDLIGSKQL